MPCPSRWGRSSAAGARRSRTACARLVVGDAAAARARAGRHRGRHRHQCASGFRRGASAPHLAAERQLGSCPATTTSRRCRPGHGGGAVRPAQGHRREPDEDRQRSALDEQRAAGGPGRDRAAGAAAGQQHHAGQGQSGDARGDHHGGGAGDRQRCDHHHRRAVGQLPAERDAAGDRLQPAGEHRLLGIASRNSPTARSRASR